MLAMCAYYAGIMLNAFATYYAHIGLSLLTEFKKDLLDMTEL